MKSLQAFFQKTARVLPLSFRTALTTLYQRLFRIIFEIASFPNPIGKSSLEKNATKKKILEKIWDSTESIDYIQRQTWTLKDHQEQDISRMMQRCFDEKGVYPISFSIPVFWSGTEWSPKVITDSLSKVFPGQPYSYTDSDQYMHQYNNSALGLTFKKGGWDCFRHLEIISAGALPLMPDIQECPEFTMVHYPKRAFEAIERNFQGGLMPDASVHRFVFEWAKSNLSSKAMMRRVLGTIPVAPKRVLFIDEQLPKQSDYLSVFSLIGLLQLSSLHVDVAFPVDYIFQDWQGDDASLYGKGFGYSRVLGPEYIGNAWCSAGTCGRAPSLTDNERSSSYDVVVVGDVTSNRKLTKLVELEFTQSKLLFLRGDDLAPTRNEYKWLRALNGYVFSREIY